MSQSLEVQLAPLVKALNNKKKATFFLGAGISTSCGIPDFRSPKTGLYANLKRLKLPYPEAVFDIDYFRDDPRAFYTLCDELYPGKFFPSKFHYLLKLFQDKGHLRRIYTQNIDTMESIVGVDPENIVAAHGSFAENHCIDCSAPMATETLVNLMNDKSKNDGIPQCRKCGGYVKPDIVFFGEALPGRFYEAWEDDYEDTELAIVAGTSLTVYPFAGLPSECKKSALRVLVNKEVVGDFKTKRRKTDLIFTEDCDTVADSLARSLGWHKELEDLMEKERKKFYNKTAGRNKGSSATNKKDITAERSLQQEDAVASKAAKKSEKLATDLEEQLEKLSIR